MNRNAMFPPPTSDDSNDVITLYFTLHIHNFRILIDSDLEDFNIALKPCIGSTIKVQTSDLYVYVESCALIGQKIIYKLNYSKSAKFNLLDVLNGIPDHLHCRLSHSIIYWGSYTDKHDIDNTQRHIATMKCIILLLNGKYYTVSLSTESEVTDYNEFVSSKEEQMEVDKQMEVDTSLYSIVGKTLKKTQYYFKK
jgi:hypothetical protein